MRKNFKILLGGLLSLTILFGVCNNSYASGVDDTSKVTAYQDGIKFEKSAEWIKLQGKSEDDNSKTYAKIDFSVNRAVQPFEQNTSAINEGSIDVFLVLDSSDSMNWDNRSARMKQSAINFVDVFFDERLPKRRLGVVSFSGSASVISRLYADKEYTKNNISYMFTGGPTNLQDGIRRAQAELEISKADKKFMIILSDGEPTMELDPIPFEHIADGKDCYEKVINQANMAREYVDNLTIMTIGLGTYYKYDELLKEISSKNPVTGETYFFKDDDVTGNCDRLFEIYNDIYNNIVDYRCETITDIRIEDQLPEGVEYVSCSIDNKHSVSNVDVTFDEKTRILTIRKNQFLEDVDLKISVIVRIDPTCLDKEYWNKTKFINTNGKSMDIFTDSQDSAVLYTKFKVNNFYSKLGIISPQLELDDSMIPKEENKTPDVLPEVTPEPTPEETKEPVKEETPKVTPEPIPEETKEVAKEETSNSILEDTDQDEVKEEEILNIEDNDIPLSDESEKPIIENIAPKKVVEELDYTPKTGYSEDMNIDEEYKFPFLVKSNTTKTTNNMKGSTAKVFVIVSVIIFTILGIVFWSFMVYDRKKER